MQSLVAAIGAAKQELSLLLFDRDSLQVLGQPCTITSLGSAQRRFSKLQRAMPPSYFEFLHISDGWLNFQGELHLLAGAEQNDPWVIEVAGLSRDALGSGRDPFATMVPLGLIRAGLSRMVFFDASKPDEAGELPVVIYMDLEEDSRHPSFRAYLEWYAAALATAIEIQKKGDPQP